MSGFFHNYAHLIIFIHVLGALIWIGGMIAVRIAVHPVMQSIEDPKIKLGKTLEITGRLFNLVLPFIILILASGLLMAVALNGHEGENRTVFIVKEAIWTLMTINYAFMYYRRAKAWNLFKKGVFPEAKALVTLIPNTLLPINIVLGLAALWLGITLRGF